MPGRVRSAAHVYLASGMIRETRLSSVLELVRGVASGQQNPALIYRVHASGHGAKVAVVDRERAVTFAELDERIDRVAAGLARSGIGRRARMILMTRNRLEFLEVSAACARSGAGAVSVGWRSTAQELAYVAAHSGAAGLLVERDLLPVVASVQAELPAALLANVFVVGEGTSAPEGLAVRAYAELLAGGPPARGGAASP